jgi:hypothetical protein
MRRCNPQCEALPASAEREPAALTGSRLLGTSPMGRTAQLGFGRNHVWSDQPRAPDGAGGLTKPRGARHGKGQRLQALPVLGAALWAFHDAEDCRHRESCRCPINSTGSSESRKRTDFGTASQRSSGRHRNSGPVAHHADEHGLFGPLVVYGQQIGGTAVLISPAGSRPGGYRPVPTSRRRGGYAPIRDCRPPPGPSPGCRP